jgi:hypothetical protein
MTREHNKTGRSRRILGRFLALQHYLLGSLAWKSLSLPARCTFIELARTFNGSNNGRLAMSARMLSQEMPISRQTGQRALVELEQRGFISRIRPGGFNVKSGIGRATEWRLNDWRCDVTGEPPSKAFMRWQGGQRDSAASRQRRAGPMGEPR